jgi:hypothetical protein
MQSVAAVATGGKTKTAASAAGPAVRSGTAATGAAAVVAAVAGSRGGPYNTAAKKRAAEGEAARAHNIMAARGRRGGLTPNIIPPEAASTGLKRVTPALATPATEQRKTSKFTGVYWDKIKHKWRAECTGKYLGYHATEDDAARAYNIEARRLGLTLNVIPPARAAGATAGAAAGAMAGVGVGAGVGAGACAIVGDSAGRKRAAPKAAVHATAAAAKVGWRKLNPTNPVLTGTA